MVLCEAFNESRGQRCRHRAVGIDGQHPNNQRVVWLCRYHIREGINYRIASSDSSDANSNDGWEEEVRFSESEPEEPDNLDVVVNNVLCNLEWNCTTSGYVSDDCRYCVICQDVNSSIEDMVALQSCGHTYHTYCIDGWVREAVKRGLKKRSADCVSDIHVQCPCCRRVCESLCPIGKPSTGFFMTSHEVEGVCRLFMYFQ